MAKGADFEREELSLIVRKVIAWYLRSRERRCGKRTLVILTDWVTGIEDTLDYCQEHFNPEMTDYLLEKTYPGVNKMGSIFHVGKEDDERQLIDQLGKYERLFVMCPSIKTLRAVSSGEPEGVANRAMLQLILNQAEARFMMNFNPQNLPAGRFSTELRKLIEDVADMGVQFEFGLPDGAPAPEFPVLITVETVDAAYQAGKRLIKAGEKTIVTPLARERADDLHMKIMK